MEKSAAPSTCPTSSEFVDEDGDSANEFYMEELRADGKGFFLKKITNNLAPKKAEKLDITRLNSSLTVVLLPLRTKP